jgi:hypothetical protein
MPIAYRRNSAIFLFYSSVRVLHDPPGHREALGDQQGRHSEAQLQRWHLSHQQVRATVC